MNEIGQILKTRREELGYTLSKMSERTKVPLAKLQAIEDGNVAYFQNELSYVKFYVRYYFNSLHLNYEDYKDRLDEALDNFTHTERIKKIEEINQINLRVKQHIKKTQKGTEFSRGPKFKKTVKTNVGFISMFIVSALIIIALVYVFISAVLPMLNINKKDDTVIVIPDPIVQEEEPDVIEEPVVALKFTINKTGLINYEISGYTQNQETTFIIQLPNSMTWLSSKVDGVTTVTPARGYYEKGESYTLIVTAQNEMVVELYIGYLSTPVISINGEQIIIDDSLVSSKSKSSFYFTFKGVTP